MKGFWWFLTLDLLMYAPDSLSRIKHLKTLCRLLMIIMDNILKKNLVAELQNCIGTCRTYQREEWWEIANECFMCQHKTKEPSDTNTRATAFLEKLVLCHCKNVIQVLNLNIFSKLVKVFLLCNFNMKYIGIVNHLFHNTVKLFNLFAIRLTAWMR